MRKTLLTLFALVLFANANCQDEANIKKEKQAIIAVIEEETNSFYNKDFKRFAACYVQDDTFVRLGNSGSSYSYIVGWDGFTDIFLGDWFDNNSAPIKNNEVKKNYTIKVYEDCAWVVFDQGTKSKGKFIRKNIGVNFLEKVNGEWKIVFLSRVESSAN